MTDKQLRKLSRRDLLEILLIQSRELDQVKQELKEARAELEKRQIAISTSGSIAEAALKLSGIFEAAQEAAGRYLESLAVPPEERRAFALAPVPEEPEEAVSETQALCRQMLADARRESAEILTRAEQTSRHLQYDALRRELNLLAEELSNEP